MRQKARNLKAHPRQRPERKVNPRTHHTIVPVMLGRAIQQSSATRHATRCCPVLSRAFLVIASFVLSLNDTMDFSLNDHQKLIRDTVRQQFV